MIWIILHVLIVVQLLEVGLPNGAILLKREERLFVSRPYDLWMMYEPVAADQVRT